MKLPRFRVRTLMIAVAVLAPVFWVAAAIIGLGVSLENFYGPGGILELEHDYMVQVGAADADLDAHRFTEAGAGYREVLVIRRKLAAKGSQSFGREDDLAILAKLACALAGQGRYGEADALVRPVVASLQASPGPDGSTLEYPLLGVARYLRQVGRVDEAQSFEERAAVIEEGEAATYRQQGRADVAEARTRRAAAIRQTGSP